MEVGKNGRVLLTAACFALCSPAYAATPACRLAKFDRVDITKFEASFRKSFCARPVSCDRRWANFRELAMRAFHDRRIANVGTVAYMFATAWGETSNLDFAPASEQRRNNTSSGYWKPVNGRTYQGRGWIQLTWYDKYRLATTKTGADFLENPNEASKPGSAYEILYRALAEGWLEVYRKDATGKSATSIPVKLGDFVGADSVDYDRARAIINANCRKKPDKTCFTPDVPFGPGYLPPASGLDRAAEIGDRARRFERMICDAAS